MQAIACHLSLWTNRYSRMRSCHVDREVTTEMEPVTAELTPMGLLRMIHMSVGLISGAKVPHLPNRRAGALAAVTHHHTSAALASPLTDAVPRRLGPAGFASFVNFRLCSNAVILSIRWVES
jgi:hypothetical protein